MQGDISVRSSAGRGSILIIRVPGKLDASVDAIALSRAFVVA
jgi:signal transduction histidine kinase